jgi:hypothetical protein
VYKKAVLDELIQNTRRLADQAALIAQSGDYSDAVELLEERILYQEKPDSQQQPWMHPYHAALFRIYLQLQQTLAAMQTTSQSAPVLIQDLQYTTAILECLDAQLLGGHPEAADFLYHKGELFRTLQTMQHGGASVRVREVPRLVPQSNGGSKNGELNMDSLSLEENNSAAATSSAVSSSSSPCSSVPSFYKLISSAYLNFARACEIRITARGKAHELTRQAGQCADGLQAAYEKEAGQGLYSKDFDNDEATAAAGKSKAKEKGGKR